LLPEVYSKGKWVIFIIGIGKLIEVITGSNGIILLNSKHYRVSFYTSIVLIAITITANYLLIPVYGIIGAALASALALLVYNSVKYIYIWLRMEMQPFTMGTLVVIILGSFTLYIANVWISFDNVYIDVPVKSLFFTFAYLIPLLMLKTSPDLNNLIHSLLKKIVK